MKETIDPKTLNYNNCLRFKTNTGNTALLVRINGTKSDFCLFILQKDEDTIEEAYRINNCILNLDPSEDNSVEVSMEFNCDLPVDIADESKEKIAEQLIINNRIDMLNIYFDNVLIHNGTETSDCNCGYDIESNEYILTDGVIISNMERCMYGKEVRVNTEVKGSNYVIVVELDKTDITHVLSSLYVNKNSLTDSDIFHHILNDTLKIREHNFDIWNYMFDEKIGRQDVIEQNTKIENLYS